MLELYIIRHGLAGSRLEDEARDKERPLTKKGKEKMKDIAKGLKKLKISLNTIFSSPLLRAKETADIVNIYCGDKKEVMITEHLSPDASFTALIKVLNKFKDQEKIAIVGHEPFLSSFASYCLTKNKNSLLNLKKGGVLKLEIDEMIKPGECKLSWLMEPKQIASLR